MSVTIGTLQKYIKASGDTSDNFQAYTDGNLGGQGNWVAGINNLTVVDFSGDKRVYASNTSTFRLCYINLTFPNDQWCEITIDTTINTNSFIGPAVRCSGTNGYVLTGSSNWIALNKFISGTPTELDSVSTTIAAGDVIRLSVTGNTLRCWVNGSPVTSLGDSNGDVASGGELTSGKIGIGAYTDAAGLTYIDDLLGLASS